MTGWKKKASRAVMVWCLTYVTGLIILIMTQAEHPFVVALLPTLATVYSNIGILKEAVRSKRIDTTEVVSPGPILERAQFLK